MNPSGQNKGVRFAKIVHVLFRYQLLTRPTPEKLCLAFQALGPLYIKLGQFLSQRRDFLPAEYCNALEKLYGAVDPIPSQEVAESLGREYGSRFSAIFACFDEKALAAASVAQVNRAVLTDGEEVAVKVLRPGIRETAADDLKLFRRLAPLVGKTKLGKIADPLLLLQELDAAVDSELNLLHEAENLDRFHQATGCSCPKVFREYSTENILVMEYIHGTRLDQVTFTSENDPARKQLARLLILDFSRQLFGSGLFHGDPHKANLILRDGRPVWIDLGLLGSVSKEEQAWFTRGIQAFIQGHPKEIAAILLEMCEGNKERNLEGLSLEVEKAMEKFRSQSVNNLNMKDFLTSFMKAAARYEVTMPEHVAVLTRSVITFAGLLTECCGELTPVDVLSAIAVVQKEEACKNEN